VDPETRFFACVAEAEARDAGADDVEGLRLRLGGGVVRCDEVRDQALDFDEGAGPGVNVEEGHRIGGGGAGVDEMRADWLAVVCGFERREGDEGAELGECGVEGGFLGAPVVGF